MFLSKMQDKWEDPRGGGGWLIAVKDKSFLYLLSSPGPSPLMMTECHRLRQVMSHSPSFDFPEPGSWWTACLWECPPRTLEGGRRAFFHFLHYCRKFHTPSYCLFTSIIIITHLYKSSWIYSIILFLEVPWLTSHHEVHNDFTWLSKLLWDFKTRN